MEHSFDIDIAKDYGINCAIILKHLYYWVNKNRYNEKHFRDGMYWTYSSVKALENLFPYLSKNQINSAIQKLILYGLIVEGNHNKLKFDRTKWYALTEKGFDVIQKSEMHFLKSEMDLPEIRNDISENQKPIPDITTDTIPDKKEDTPIQKDEQEQADELFERLWKLYPRKMGKGNVKPSTKRKLLKIGYDELSRCVERYLKTTSEWDQKYIAYGGTFFNSGYIDFLDSNYNDGNETSKHIEPLHPDRPDRWQSCPSDLWDKLKPCIKSDGTIDWITYNPELLTESDKNWMRQNGM